MPVYSFSQIQLYRSCPLKYRLQYIDKIRPAEFVMSPDLAFGKAVHTALESLYKALNTYQQVDKTLLHQRFEQSMDKERSEVPGEVDRSSYDERGTRYLEAYWQKYAPFEHIQVVATEKQLIFSLDDAGQVKFRGVIDRIDKQQDTLIITDYKTSRHLPDSDQTTYQEQLTLYAIGIEEKYGKYANQIECQIEYLHFGSVDRRSINEETIGQVKAEFLQKVTQIQQQLFKYNMGDAHAFPAIENSGCRYCEYRDICPLRSHMQMDDEVVTELGDKTIRMLVDEYGSLDEQKKSLTKQQDSIKVSLKQYASHKKIENLFGEHYRVSVSSTPNYKINDKERLAELLKQKSLLDEYQSVDQYKIKAALKNGLLKQSDLAGCITIEDSYTLRVGKNKLEK